MDYNKVRPPDSFNPADVAPLPSAPPPSYEDAMGASSSFGDAALIQSTTPLTKGNPGYPSGIQPPYPVQSQPYPIAPVHQPPSYPAQPQHYPVQQVQIAQQAGSVSTSRYLPVGRQPLKTTCTSCNTFISTRIKTKNNCHPTFWCCVLFITGVCIPCSCCPYFCCDKPYRVDHFCPKCNAFLGTYVDAS